MKPILCILAALPMCATGQVVQLVPTSYALCIRQQNNVGKLWPSWRDETRDCVTLSNRVLTFTHTVFYDVPYMGTKWGGPKLLEDSYRYRQIGGASYVPLGGEEITFFAPRIAGGWIAQTNPVPAVAMTPIFWLPGLVGEFETGDKFRRTVTTGSALVMNGRNLQGSPYLLRVPCEPDFCFAFAFKANERKAITLSMDTVSWFSNGDLQGFVFDLENCTDEALP